MASQTNNIGTTVLILAVITLFMASLFYITGDISDKNTKLDTQSQLLMNNLGQEYRNNYNSSDYFSLAQNDITTNSTFEGVDAFSRQYLEDKSEIQQKKGTIEQILLFPSLFLMIFGVDDSLMLIAFSGIIYGLLSFYLGLQIYKAIRTGEVD